MGAAGTGIGTFVYAPLTQWLIETYGWRGATLILGGTLLNVCVCGCLMRDPFWLIEENRMGITSQSVLTVSNSSVCLDEIRKMIEIGTPGETVLDTLVTSLNTEANQQFMDADKASEFKKYCSESVLPTFMYSSEFGSTDAELTRGSRFSLRGKEVAINAVFATAGNQMSTRPRFLASTETLNASEKYSQCDNSSIATKKNRNMTSGNACSTQKSSSRLSLDETLIGNQNKRSSDPEDSHKKRSCSLGAFLEAASPDEKLSRRKIAVVMPPIDCIQSNSANSLPRRRHLHHRQLHNNEGIVSIRNLRRHSHHFQHMRVHRHGMNYRGAMLNTHRYRLKASSCPNVYRNSMTTLAKEEEDVSHF